MKPQGFPRTRKRNFDWVGVLIAAAILGGIAWLVVAAAVTASRPFSGL